MSLLLTWFVDSVWDHTIFELNVLVHTIVMKGEPVEKKGIMLFKKTCKGDTHWWWLTLSTVITLINRQGPASGNFCTRYIEMHTKIRLCWRAKQTTSYRTTYTPVQNKMAQDESPYGVTISFYPNGSNLFQDENIHIHRTQGSEWFNEYEDMNISVHEYILYTK